MPKEVVKDTSNMFDVVVGWSKENEFVQVSVNEFYSTMSAETIDQLVKVLRKAKRQAFR